MPKGNSFFEGLRLAPSKWKRPTQKVSILHWFFRMSRLNFDLHDEVQVGPALLDVQVALRERV